MYRVILWNHFCYHSMWLSFLRRAAILLSSCFSLVLPFNFHSIAFRVRTEGSQQWMKRRTPPPPLVKITLFLCNCSEWVAECTDWWLYKGGFHRYNPIKKWRERKILIADNCLFLEDRRMSCSVSLWLHLTNRQKKHFMLMKLKIN